MGNESDILKETINELLEIANRDGIVTPEEKDIIKQVEIDADSYLVMLAEANDDGIISDEEKLRLQELKELIKDRADLIAGLDGKIEDDERRLLEKLTELLTKYYSK
ncbi:MAG: hypothetical protein OEY49_18150 [Candidatus Heimdallarchaeota archaeon]|nr:hypothetical protein [Candidatus Heimdallarchaeota archaeon]